MADDYALEAFVEDAISDQEAWEAMGRFVAYRVPEGFAFRLSRADDPLEDLVSQAEVLSVVGDFLELGREVRALTH